MKAIVTATRDIVEVDQCSVLYDDGRRELMYGKELEEVQGIPDYWEKLLHQYAGMAMQGMLSNTSLVSILFDATKDHDEMLKEVVICSHEYAHALVEKMKEKK